MKGKSSLKWHVVFSERKPRIYPTWDECQKQVCAYSSNSHLSYDTCEEALASGLPIVRSQSMKPTTKWDLHPEAAVHLEVMFLKLCSTTVKVVREPVIVQLCTAQAQLRWYQVLGWTLFSWCNFAWLACYLTISSLYMQVLSSFHSSLLTTLSSRKVWKSGWSELAVISKYHM